jgi:hypothetical protein
VPAHRHRRPHEPLLDHAGLARLDQLIEAGPADTLGRERGLGGTVATVGKNGERKTALPSNPHLD